jgi:hypothetical protein
MTNGNNSRACPDERSVVELRFMPLVRSNPDLVKILNLDKYDSQPELSKLAGAFGRHNLLELPPASAGEATLQRRGKESHFDPSGFTGCGETHVLCQGTTSVVP